MQKDPRPGVTTTGFNSSIDAAQTQYQQARLLHWNAVARQLETWTGWGDYYHRRLTEIYQHLAPPGQSVLELGCARGDLLAALKPDLGIGVDFSEEMLRAVLKVAESLDLAKPTLYQNWLTVEDIAGLLNLTDCEMIKKWQEILWPVQTRS